MIFGGYGRKSKHRGDVYYPCLECEALTVFGLVENYGYGQLYGVRIAKVGSNRFMLCSQCRSGYELTKEQWRQALAFAKELGRRAHLLTSEQAGREAVQLARLIFPSDAQTVASLLELEAGNGKLAFPAGEITITPVGTFREPDDLAENDERLQLEREETLALVQRGLNLARDFDANTFRPFDSAYERAVTARDPAMLVQIATALEQHVGLMRSSPQAIHADTNYREWMRLFEEQAEHCRETADELAAALEREAVEAAAREHAEKAVAGDAEQNGDDEDMGERDEQPEAALSEERAVGPEQDDATTADETGDRPEVPLQAPTRTRADDPALAIARERYARGEISREEFLQLRDDFNA